MAAVDKVKVLVVGDSGVGKTAFAHLLAYDRPSVNPTSTIGCAVEVKLHEYKAGTPLEKLFFVELWDVGGSRGHGAARSIFYHNVDGIVLVHDLCNRKSLTNLRRWLVEILGAGSCNEGDYDPETFADLQIPMLVVGTKLDLQVRTGDIGQKRQGTPASSVADECNADEILVECGAGSKNIAAAGSSNAVKIVRFFDKVIEQKLRGSRSTVGSRDQPSSFPGLLGAAQERKRILAYSIQAGKAQHSD